MKLEENNPGKPEQKTPLKQGGGRLAVYGPGRHLVRPCQGVGGELTECWTKIRAVSVDDVVWPWARVTDIYMALEEKRLPSPDLKEGYWGTASVGTASVGNQTQKMTATTRCSGARTAGLAPRTGGEEATGPRRCFTSPDPTAATVTAFSGSLRVPAAPSDPETQGAPRCRAWAWACVFPVGGGGGALEHQLG